MWAGWRPYWAKWIYLYLYQWIVTLKITIAWDVTPCFMVICWQYRRRHVPEDSNIHGHSLENLKSPIVHLRLWFLCLVYEISRGYMFSLNHPPFDLLLRSAGTEMLIELLSELNCISIPVLLNSLSYLFPFELIVLVFACKTLNVWRDASR
jgi:hypothetical protein